MKIWKSILLTTALLILAGIIVITGNQIQKAQAAFSGPVAYELTTQRTEIPELGVVELKGVVESIAADSYVISGVTFRYDDLTIFSSDPVAGDVVMVKAMLLPDLTYYALKVETTDKALIDGKFEFYGFVETIGVDMWTLSGIQVGTNKDTMIDPGIESGDLVKVEGSVMAGQLAAEEIRLKMSSSSYTGSRVVFYGSIESITAGVFVIGGKTVNTNAMTEIKGELAVGSLVKVEGTLNADGTYLASEIKPVNSTMKGDDDYSHDDSSEEMDDEHSSEEVKFTGVIESISDILWVVGGKNLTVTSTTKIEGSPEIGDTVKVEAYVQADGSLLAHEIEFEADEAMDDDGPGDNDDDDDDLDYDDDDQYDEHDHDDDDHDDDSHDHDDDDHDEDREGKDGRRKGDD